MTITIRTATPDDHKRICDLGKTSKFTRDISNAVMFSSPAAYAKGWLKVAIDDESGDTVGFYCIREKVRAPETVLYFITVDPEMRGRGIGELLLADLMLTTRHKCLTLNVAKDNDGARRFYERLGFETVGESLGGTGLALRRTW